jgi:hypothetical protein
VNKYKNKGKFRVVWVPEYITRITKLISGNDNDYANLGSGTSGSGNSGSGNSGTGNGYRVFCPDLAPREELGPEWTEGGPGAGSTTAPVTPCTPASQSRNRWRHQGAAVSRAVAAAAAAAEATSGSKHPIPFSSL